jgi:hypothetical protein
MAFSNTYVHQYPQVQDSILQPIKHSLHGAKTKPLHHGMEKKLSIAMYFYSIGPDSDVAGRRAMVLKYNAVLGRVGPPRPFLITKTNGTFTANTQKKMMRK